jgi:signal transduction histidine kinase/ligand-binding sensor domain-containing protein
MREYYYTYKKCFSIIFLLLFLETIAYSQSADLRFVHYRTIDGLISNTINGFFQDSKSFIWIATNEGISKFDGNNFYNFRINDTDSGSLHEADVNIIYEDTRGNIWIGTQNTLERYLVDKNKIELIKVEPNYNKNIRITSVCELNDGRILFGNDVLGIFEYNYKTKSLGIFRMVDVVGEPLSRILSIHQESDSIIWVSSDNIGVFRYNIFTEKYSKYVYSIDKYPLTLKNLTKLMFSKSGDLYLSSYANGIFIYDKQLDGFKLFASSGNKWNLTTNQILNIAEDKNQNIWIASEYGIDMLNLEEEKLNHYCYDKDDPFSLSNDKCWNLLIDNSNNLWVGHYLGGVSYANVSSKKNFYTSLRTGQEKNTLSNQYISCFLETSDGKLMIGTDGGGINIYDKKNNCYTYLRHDPNNKNSLSSDVIQEMIEDIDGNIWIATFGGGLCKFNPHKNQFKVYPNVSNDLNAIYGKDIRSVVQDRNGDLWLSTNGVGLYRMNIKNEKFYNIQYDKNEKSEENLPHYLRKLFIDSEGELWIASYAGLGRYNITTRKFTRYLSNRATKNALINDVVNNISENSNGELIFSTTQGISIYNKKEGLFTNIERNTDLPNSSIMAALEDNNNNLWISSLLGIASYNRKTRVLKQYNYSDGISGNTFIVNSALKDSQGIFYFGSSSGFTYFDPEKIYIDTTKVKTNITDLYINYKLIEPGDSESKQILSESILNTSAIKLNYKHKIINIHFSGIYYPSPSKIKYRYMLEGFNSSWVEQQNEGGGVATYTNLAPGKYIFKVVAANGDGVWCNEPTILTITMKPPFWATWLFRITIIIIIALCFWGFYIYRIKAIINRNKQLEKAVNERTIELCLKNEFLNSQTAELKNANKLLEEKQLQIQQQAEILSLKNGELSEANNLKDKFFSILAHDLRNPIGVCMSFIEYFSLNRSDLSEEKKDTILENIKKALERTYNLLENILLWARSQQGRLVVKKETFDINDIVSLSIDLVMSQALKKNLEIINNINKPIMVIGDKNMIDTVLRNLLTNAIKFTNINGTITISTSVTLNEMELFVQDNGIGISPDILKNLFHVGKITSLPATEGEVGSGIGLILCAEFIQKNGGEIRVKSEVGKGSIFSITLPLA